jgi:hypothetical protein
MSATHINLIVLIFVSIPGTVTVSRGTAGRLYMLFAGYGDITRRQSFGCPALTKISQKIDNFIARVSQYENIGGGGRIDLEAAQVCNKKIGRSVCLSVLEPALASSTGEGKLKRLICVAPV